MNIAPGHPCLHIPGSVGRSVGRIRAGGLVRAARPVCKWGILLARAAACIH